MNIFIDFLFKNMPFPYDLPEIKLAGYGPTPTLAQVALTLQRKNFSQK